MEAFPLAGRSKEGLIHISSWVCWAGSLCGLCSTDRFLPAGGKTSGHSGTTVTILLQERHLSSGALGKRDNGQFNNSKGCKWLLNQGKYLNISRRDILSIVECTHSHYGGSLAQPFLGTGLKTCYEIQNLAST